MKKYLHSPKDVEQYINGVAIPLIKLVKQKLRDLESMHYDEDITRKKIINKITEIYHTLPDVEMMQPVLNEQTRKR